MLRLLFLLMLIFSSFASARMYQWVDPDSGSTQLSGKPPLWYRSMESGPRVFVFEKNRIIDDTGIEVSDTERERLRQQAFLQADEDREHARKKLLESKRLDAALKQKQASGEKEEEFLEPVQDEPVAQEPEEVPPPVVESTEIEQMKKLIEDWEKATTEKARGLLDMSEPPPQ